MNSINLYISMGYVSFIITWAKLSFFAYQIVHFPPATTRCLKARETEAMPLVTRTPLAWEMDHRDFTNRVCRGEV